MHDYEDPSSVPLVDVARAFDGSRLTQARRIAGLTKSELHRRIGISAAQIGQYERNESFPRQDSVRALAEALNVPASFFAGGRRRVHVEIGQASFRRLRATTSAQQQQAIAYVEQVWELASYLEESVEFPELDLPGWARANDEVDEHRADPITAARLLRKHWALGSDPIQFLVAELENRGIVTVLFSLKEDATVDESRHIDAFSTSSLTRPLIVLTPDKADDVFRHRFSAAHELGHLILHHARPGSDATLEREADAFASEFLTPRDSLLPDLPRRFSVPRLQELSLHWGVSMKSLIYRSKELEVISEASARRGYVTLNGLAASGVIRSEPIARYPGEQPELLRNAIELLEGAGVSRASIAADLQMTEEHVCRLAGLDQGPPRLTLVR